MSMGRSAMRRLTARCRPASSRLRTGSGLKRGGEAGGKGSDCHGLVERNLGSDCPAHVSRRRFCRRQLFAVGRRRQGGGAVAAQRDLRTGRRLAWEEDALVKQLSSTSGAGSIFLSTTPARPTSSPTLIWTPDKPEGWRRISQVNVFGTWLISRVAVPRLREARGSIITSPRWRRPPSPRG